MKVAVIQVATILGQPQKNRICLEGYIHQALQEQNDIDVVVFPETWNIGFFPINVEEVAEDSVTSESLVWMKECARKHSINIVGGSIAVKEEGQLYNRSYVINRLGEVIYHYDKAHLFSPGKEPVYFTPGSQNSLFEMDGIPCALQICYDIRFPEYARQQALAGAKMLFVPAQWPHPRSNHWLTLTKARAIENQLFVIANNGCGKAGSLQSCGHSIIYSPWGEELAAAKEKEGVYIAQLDISQVDEVRNIIPVFQDRLPELYGRI